MRWSEFHSDHLTHLCSLSILLFLWCPRNAWGWVTCLSFQSWVWPEYMLDSVRCIYPYFLLIKSSLQHAWTSCSCIVFVAHTHTHTQYMTWIYDDDMIYIYIYIYIYIGGRGKGLEFGFESRFELSMSHVFFMSCCLRCLCMCVFFKDPLKYKIVHLNGLNLQCITIV